MPEQAGEDRARGRRIDRRLFLRLAFLAAGLITAALAVRLALRLASLRRHAGEKPAAWMPIGYVARIHGVDPVALRAALGLGTDVPDRRTIEEIASERSVPLDAFIAEVEAAVTRLKQAGAG